MASVRMQIERDMSDKMEKVLFRVAAFAWMAMVVWFSSRPGSEVKIDHPVDKVIHAGVYGMLSFLLALGTGRRTRPHALWLVPLLVLGFGLTDEFHQSFVPGRSVSLGDLGADAAGAVTATLLWWLARRQGRREVTGQAGGRPAGTWSNPPVTESGSN